MINLDRIMRVMRIKILNKPGTFGKIADTIGINGGNMGDIKVIRIGSKYITRDITVYSKSPAQFQKIVDEVSKHKEIKILETFDEIYSAHEGGLIEIKSKVKIDSISSFEKYYMPGIAQIADAINQKRERVYDYTNIGKIIGVVTNGSSLLNFQNSQTEAAYSVMEAISAVLNQISSIEAVPLVLDTENKEEFINTIKVIHKNFGMIIIEDVTSPQSIEIEESLQDLKIPVIDTNKYGNAVVTLAGLMNIAKKEDIDLRNSRVGFLGFGSKASGITKLLKAYGVKEIKAYDIKEEPQDRMNKLGVKVEKDINDLMQSVDIVIGTSRIGGLIKFGMVKKGQIILALSKPEPEIKPEIAMKAGAKYAGDGRLINPFLAIPGLIKGTLEAKAESVTIKMMIEAAETIASYVKAEDILPGMFDEGLHEAVAAVVKRTAVEEGVAHLREFEIEEDIKDKADDIFEKIKEVNEWMTN